MRFSIITKWELKETLKSKKFLTIFFLQISVLFLMIFIFNTFAANIESEKGISITPSLSGFASLDVDDQGHLFSKYINPEIIEVKNYSYNNSLERLKAGQTTGFVFVPEDSIEKIRNIGTINIQLYLDVSDPKRSVIKDEVNSTTKIMGDSISNSWVDSIAPQNTTPTVNQQNTGESLPLQIITKAMIAILLFLPLFLFGNMMIDSVVGEKERKTGEILMAMPLSTTEIIIGKSMAVVGIIAIQVALWMSILLLTGFQIISPLLVYMLVFITAIPVIGITVVIAAYSKNYKEAGIGLTFGYVLSVGILMVPALVYLSNKSLSSNISPLTMVIRILSGENIPIWQFLIPLGFVIIVSVIAYWISIKLFERDDVVFGPRPGLIRLSLELVGLKKRRKTL
ncbi:MAG: ABC transporter permease [Methanobacterium sp.]|nr:ABC transporter permease [Methanobacterium sp.]